MDEYNGYSNFYVDENGIAYTDNGVVVKNMCIYDVPLRVTEEDMRRYFSKFSKLTNVQLLPSQNAGFVHFVDPLAAAMALKKPNHTLLGRAELCNVKSCNSWDQPSATGGTTAESSKNGASTLLQLNDDCLLHIFGYLELAEQIDFAMANSRLTAVFQIHSKNDFTEFDFRNLYGLEPWQKRELLRMVGSKVETITLCDLKIRRDRTVDFACRWCTNVKCFTMVGNMTYSEIQLLQNMKQITDLSLKHTSLAGNIILNISKLPNLRTLSLSQCYDFTGQYLDRLTMVQKLDLYNCRGLKAPFVRDALIALPQLRSLNLLGCDMDTTIFEGITGDCSKLEVLKIQHGANDAFDCVVQLPSLKQLTLYSGTHSSNKVNYLLTLLTKYKAAQLEGLEFWGDFEISQTDAVLLAQLKHLRWFRFIGGVQLDDACLYEFAKLECLQELAVSCNNNITDEGVESVLRGCTKLKDLILNYCRCITPALLHRTIEALEETQAERNALVEIHVYTLALRKSTVEADPKYIAASARNLLKMHC